MHQALPVLKRPRREHFGTTASFSSGVSPPARAVAEAALASAVTITPQLEYCSERLLCYSESLSVSFFASCGDLDAEMFAEISLSQAVSEILCYTSTNHAAGC